MALKLLLLTPLIHVKVQKFILIINKGFWLFTTTVPNPAFAEYFEAFQPWIESVGCYVFAKDIDCQNLERKGCKLAVIFGFPSN